MMKALRARLRLPQRLKDESGVALFEYAIALPVFMMLVFFAIAICWFWWQQNIAVVALHEGTNLDAIHGGAVYDLPPTGSERTKAILIAALGATAPDFRTAYHINRVEGVRSFSGSLNLHHAWNIPLLGWFQYTVKGQSFQRNWQFYGGPPIRGPKGEWE
jgi:hypothetical protein